MQPPSELSLLFEDKAYGTRVAVLMSASRPPDDEKCPAAFLDTLNFMTRIAMAASQATVDTTWRLEDVQWAIVEEQKPVAVKRETLEKALEDATDGGS